MRWAKGQGEMMMRTLLIVVTIIGLSASAFAQAVAPKVGGKPLKQVNRQFLLNKPYCVGGKNDKIPEPSI
jgi:hypothetical protein